MIIDDNAEGRSKLGGLLACLRREPTGSSPRETVEMGLAIHVRRRPESRVRFESTIDTSGPRDKARIGNGLLGGNTYHQLRTNSMWAGPVHKALCRGSGVIKTGLSQAQAFTPGLS